jgi:SAM-dependent methyltransferase
MANNAQDDQQPAALFQNPGFCPCCRSETTFQALRDWLRDAYICPLCGSIPRLRHLQYVLDTRFVGWEQLTIHESSPSADFIQRYATDYTSSQYFPGVPSGEVVEGVICQDLENLSLPDESIDLFITQDVLEHVFDPQRAVQEIHRVLRPGGAHVFTAPKHKDLLETVQRARKGAGTQVEHLLAEEYHGSPVGDHRILVTFDYGYDFERLLASWAAVSVSAVHTVDRSHGIDAEFNEVFIIQKPPYPPAQRLTQTQLTQLNQALASSQATIRSLTEQLAASRHALDELKASTSWQLTKPLRLTTDKLRALRQRRTPSH